MAGMGIRMSNEIEYTDHGVYMTLLVNGRMAKRECEVVNESKGLPPPRAGLMQAVRPILYDGEELFESMDGIVRIIRVKA